jgi:hypothetical protein
MKIYHEGILEWKFSPLDRIDPALPRERQTKSNNDYLSYAIRMESSVLSKKTRNKDILASTTPSTWVLKYDQSF